MSGLSGAATQIRTGDLILTKDVLYQLSHSSKVHEYFRRTQAIISKEQLFVNRICKKILNSIHLLKEGAFLRPLFVLVNSHIKLKSQNFTESILRELLVSYLDNSNLLIGNCRAVVVVDKSLEICLGVVYTVL